MKKIIVNELNDLDIVLRVTRAMLDSQGKLQVVVKKFERNISQEQQGLYFKWLGIIGGDLGNTKDEMHQIYKERFLLNIFVADPDSHQKFCKMIEDLNALKKEAPDRRNSIREYILSTVSVM
ncbi:MAG: hypothetical protein JZU65_22620, partial [Chlorobium sp.]|nr:hypothetical protein [Chlorobium sp.]